MLEKDFVQQSDPALSGQVCPIRQQLAQQTWRHVRDYADAKTAIAGDPKAGRELG